MGAFGSKLFAAPTSQYTDAAKEAAYLLRSADARLSPHAMALSIDEPSAHATAAFASIPPDAVAQAIASLSLAQRKLCHRGLLRSDTAARVGRALVRAGVGHALHAHPDLTARLAERHPDVLNAVLDPQHALALAAQPPLVLDAGTRGGSLDGSVLHVVVNCHGDVGPQHVAIVQLCERLCARLSDDALNYTHTRPRPPHVRLLGSGDPAPSADWLHAPLHALVADALQSRTDAVFDADAYVPLCRVLLAGARDDGSGVQLHLRDAQFGTTPYGLVRDFVASHHVPPPLPPPLPQEGMPSPEQWRERSHALRSHARYAKALQLLPLFEAADRRISAYQTAFGVALRDALTDAVPIADVLLLVRAYVLHSPVPHSPTT